MPIKINYLIYAVVLGAFVGWFIVTILANKFTIIKPLPSVTVKTAISGITVDKLAEDLITANTFNLDVNPPVVVDALTGDATASMLSNAKLVGAMVSPDGKRGIAIITIDDNTIAISVGKEKDGLKLIKLSKTEAEVSRGGSVYTLMLERDPSAATTGIAEKSGSTIRQSGSNINIGIKRAEVQGELKDLNKVLQSALVSPSYDGSNFQGYRVARLREDSPLTKLGLQVGDTITRINGDELKSPEVLFTMLSKLDDITAITIDILREKEKKTIFVEIQ